MPMRRMRHLPRHQSASEVSVLTMFAEQLDRLPDALATRGERDVILRELVRDLGQLMILVCLSEADLRETSFRS
jgi:hypothetical protein